MSRQENIFLGGKVLCPARLRNNRSFLSRQEENKRRGGKGKKNRNCLKSRLFLSAFSLKERSAAQKKIRRREGEYTQRRTATSFVLISEIGGCAFGQ